MRRYMTFGLLKPVWDINRRRCEGLKQFGGIETLIQVAESSSLARFRNQAEGMQCGECVLARGNTTTIVAWSVHGLSPVQPLAVQLLATYSKRRNLL